ncbi:uncharacterized protein HMPREF1541_03346 [Cyphellophora europaea CBS 101466]|uniref:BTB domain transcription factor n=1 Tax=Cyphellophora europaea (strain CBS 101466) TaxID=1220924 RepID=W2RY47_CYPE1|nr:uncharacterized protein HMPREF1541_03346 [Cyphellophora europaea CBS 101466]ETN41411.1 hypothetical protein HMPREF1541_03346 [Cyphellophora europaea CBS 101466]
MVTPRRSARVAASDSSPVYTDPPESGIVRKRKSDAAGSSPSAKRGRKSSQKGDEKQQSIEDAMDVDKKEDPKPAPAENGDTAPADKPDTDQPSAAPQATSEQQPKEDDTTLQQNAAPQAEPEQPKQENANEPKASGALQPEANEESKPGDKQADHQSEKQSEPHTNLEPAQDKSQEAATAQEQSKPIESQPAADSKPSDESANKPKPEPAAQATTNGDAVEPEARNDEVPSAILEKGIVYFFFRARVNISEPQDVNDIARSYMILRPLPKGAKLGDGPIGDEGNCRLVAIPKKVLPLSGKDRFMVFIEGAKKSFKDLKESFLSASDYATKTAGTSHSPPATPVAEGVYAITTTGRESHFAYMTTIPSSLGEVQKDVGIKEQGSFVISAKNPKAPGPANASLDKDPEYPQEILDEFNGRRWMPLQPKVLDYVNTQFLLIGESGGPDKALEGLPRDEKHGLDTPKEEVEKLEGEDEIRVKHLKGDDAVFADLGTSKKEYPAILTTWES